MERVDAALAALTPLIPGLAYYRFCAEDARCGIDLDEIDPEQVRKNPKNPLKTLNLKRHQSCSSTQDSLPRPSHQLRKSLLFAGELLSVRNPWV